MKTHQERKQEQKSQLVSDLESQSKNLAAVQFVDNRSESADQQKMHEMAKNGNPGNQTAQLKAMVDNHAAKQEHPIQKKQNKTGLPDDLKTGMENLSGHALDDVQVHRNSDEPAQLNAHAYAQGTDIHLGPGQEQHLPHEAWHVVQQKQGRVKPTAQMKEKTLINDDKGLEHEADVMGAKALSLGNGVSQLKTTNKSLNISQKEGVVQGAFYSGWFGGKGKEEATEEDPEREQLKTIDGVAVDPEVVETLTPKQQEAVQKESGGVRAGLEKIAMGGLANSAVAGLDGIGVAALAAPKPSYLENVKQVALNSGEAAQKGGFMAIMGSLFGIGLAVKGIYDGVTGAISKWSQWGAFADAAKTGLDEAIYGLTKVGKGFWMQVGLVFENVVRLTTAILMLFPLSAPFAAMIGLGHKIKDGITFLIGSGKAFYQWIKGEKKIVKTKSLVDKAADGDVAALNLIIGLKLPSLKKVIHTAEWYSVSKNEYVEDVGSSKDPEDRRYRLKEYLNGRGPIKPKGEGLDKVKKEIQKSMTGVGTADLGM
jgi:hypothetical protein